MTYDIGCPVCHSTYTNHETHECPGYDLWAPSERRERHWTDLMNEWRDLGPDDEAVSA